MSEFHDIRVPINMVNLNEIQDQNIFPSLVQAKSSSDNQSDSNKYSEKSSVEFNFGSKKKKQNKFKLKEEDFPGLSLTIKDSLNESENIG